MMVDDERNGCSIWPITLLRLLLLLLLYEYLYVIEGKLEGRIE
jgi:hypothetical protein